MAKQPSEKLSEKHDLETRERFSKILSDYQQTHALESNQAIATDIGVAPNTIQTYIGSKRNRRSRTIPSGVAIFRVLEKTGDSMDWLFGYDVPRRRSDYMRGGNLGSALATAINGARPNVSRDVAPLVSEEGIVDSAVKAWWASRLKQEREKWDQPLRKLIEKLSALEGEIPPEDELHLQLSIEAVKKAKNALDSDDATWEELDRYTRPGHITRTLGREEYRTLFYAVGGLGYAWRSAGGDVAVYIDSEKRKAVRLHQPGVEFLKRTSWEE